MQAVYLSTEWWISCFQETWRRVRVSSCVGCFLSNFNSKQYAIEAQFGQFYLGSNNSLICNLTGGFTHSKLNWWPWRERAGSQSLLFHWTSFLVLRKGEIFFNNCISFLEKDMAIHSSILAWRIPWAGEPGGLPSMGSHRVGHNLSDSACMHACISFQ